MKKIIFVIISLFLVNTIPAQKISVNDIYKFTANSGFKRDSLVKLVELQIDFTEWDCSKNDFPLYGLAKHDEVWFCMNFKDSLTSLPESNISCITMLSPSEELGGIITFWEIDSTFAELEGAYYSKELYPLYWNVSELEKKFTKLIDSSLVFHLRYYQFDAVGFTNFGYHKFFLVDSLYDLKIVIKDYWSSLDFTLIEYTYPRKLNIYNSLIRTVHYLGLDSLLAKQHGWKDPHHYLKVDSVESSVVNLMEIIK